MAGGELRFGTASIYMAKHEHIRRRRTSTKNWITWLRFRPISACISSHFNGLIVMERRKLGLDWVLRGIPEQPGGERRGGIAKQARGRCHWRAVRVRPAGVSRHVACAGASPRHEGISLGDAGAAE